jgi:AraC-like DNA-binding protein
MKHEAAPRSTPMRETPYERFLEATVGRYTVTGSSFVWCATRELCGACMWGEQTEEETRAILRIFDQYPLQMANTFAIVLDTRGVRRVNTDALAILFSWLLKNRTELAKHIRVQANVIRQGPVGYLLTGLLPVARWTLPYTVDFEAEAAFYSVAGEQGVALCTEVESITEGLRGVPRELRVTRSMLEDNLDTPIAEVGRRLGMSTRTLQRVLTRHGTSFHREVVSARFEAARRLLRTTDHKIATIATRVGISEGALTQLFRKKSGLSPTEWRKANA